jgi:hypothetical protein
MSKFWKIAGIATLVAVLGVAAVGAVAFAQDAEDGSGWPFDFRERMHEAIAGVLGISVEEYDAAIETAQEQVIDEAVTEGWLTEEQGEQMRERAAEGFGPGMRPGGPEGKFGGPGMMPGGPGGRFGGRGGFMGGPDNGFISIVAEAFDMTPQYLMAELQEGKTIAELAEEKGVDTQPIIDSHLAQLEESLAEAVTDGKITQERADWMLEQAETHITDMLNQTWEGCGPGGRPGGFRRGGFPGGTQELPGQTGA